MIIHSLIYSFLVFLFEFSFLPRLCFFSFSFFIFRFLSTFLFFLFLQVPFFPFVYFFLKRPMRLHVFHSTARSQTLTTQS